MVGDSHVRHWFHPLADISRAYGWQVVTLFSPGCNVSTKSEFLRRNDISYQPCAEWRSGLVARIDALDPDVVVALGTRIARGEREVLPRGFVEAWQKLSSRGIQVIAMRESPRHARDVPDCLAELGEDALECGTVPSEIYDERVLHADLMPGVTLLDTRLYFCLPAICPAVIGNVRVYMDDAHATDMYMRTVRPLLEPDFLALTGW
jgi:SGNH domain (fused to AT3 domains)